MQIQFLKIKKNDIIITNHEIETRLNNFKKTKIQKEKKAY